MIPIKIPKITKDTLIGEAINISTKSAQVMFEYGLHCVGCGAAGMESIEQGAKAHGMSDEEIEEMITKINEEIENDLTPNNKNNEEKN